MKIIITVQDKDLDFATDKAIDIAEVIYNKYGLKYFKCECLSNGTSILLTQWNNKKDSLKYTMN